MSDGPNGTRGFEPPDRPRVPDHQPIGHRDGRTFPTRRNGRFPRRRPAPPPTIDEDEPVTYNLRGQFRALDGESEPMNTTAITLWECSGCPGFAVFGDRLEDHTGWHRGRAR